MHSEFCLWQSIGSYHKTPINVYHRVLIDTLFLKAVLIAIEQMSSFLESAHRAEKKHCDTYVIVLAKAPL